MIDSNNKRNSYRENTRGANQYDRQQIESVAKKIRINKGLINTILSVAQAKTPPVSEKQSIINPDKVANNNNSPLFC